MATTIISNIENTVNISDIKPTKTLSNIKPFDSTISNIAVVALLTGIVHTSTATDIKPTISNIVKTDYAKVITPTSVLPFRLTITNIGIEGYDPANPPGIGVQIIGFSNYIL
jgi:hypothetical protein